MGIPVEDLSTQIAAQHGHAGDGARLRYALRLMPADARSGLGR